MDSINMNGAPSAGAGAGLTMRHEISMAASAENFWRVVNMRRVPGCDCKGCRFFRLLPEKYHEHAQELIRCERAFVAWEVEVPNLVTTEGKNDILTIYLKAGTGVAMYVGLVNNTSFTAYAAGDTAAQIGGSNGWHEGVGYSNANRVTWTGGTASGGSIDNSGAPAQFNINAGDTIRGAFLTNNNAKSGTTGKLYGEADFGAQRAVLSGDTLNVTVTCTL